jgi:hypothetical protein
MDKKKILIITYYWPPSSGSGVQRWMYFTYYLKKYGFNPLVLTVKENQASYRNVDESFLDNVSDIDTYRTSTIEPLKLYSLITSRSLKKGIPQGVVGENSKGLLHKLFSYIRGTYFIPDSRIGWNLFAYKKAKKIIKQNKIDLVITTGPPHSTHLIGLKLKNKFNIKWISDFRDPWSDLYYNKDLIRSKRAIQKDIRLEKLVLDKSDLVLTVGENLKELLVSKSPSIKYKAHHIYNGFDKVLNDSIKTKKPNHFEITFVGTLTENQPYKSLIKTLKALVQNNHEINISLRLAGNIQNKILDEIRKELHGINIIITGFVDHKTAIQLMKNANLLVNILAEMEHSRILVSGKQMEYIATGNPILCFGDTEGESAKLLSETGNSITVPKDNIEAGVNFISKNYDIWKNGGSTQKTDDISYINSKSRESTAKQLIKLINEI